jgi:hypothetical protein
VCVCVCVCGVRKSISDFVGSQAVPACTVWAEYIAIQSVPHRKHYVSATKPSRLMLFRETVAVYCENHMEHTDTLCRQKTQSMPHRKHVTSPHKAQPVNAVYCENHTEHTDTLCGHNAEFWYVKIGGTYSTTVLKKLMRISPTLCVNGPFQTVQRDLKYS